MFQGSPAVCAFLCVVLRLVLEHVSLCLFSESAGEGGLKGDEDEGFDEEFCDTDEPPAPLRPTTPDNDDDDLPPLNLQDLTDFQTLLEEQSLVGGGGMGGGDPVLVQSPPFPAPSLLDDIDPGVYMLEAEHSTHSLLGSGGEPELVSKSPLHSPFPLSAPSPLCATMSVGGNSPSSLDDWNSSHFLHYHDYSAGMSAGGSEYGAGVEVCPPGQYPHPFPSSPTTHPVASTPPPPLPLSPSSSCYELDLLVSMCNQQSSSVQTVPLTPSPSPGPYQYHHQHHHHHQGFPVVNYGGGSSPTHSLPSTPPPPPSPHNMITSPAYHSNYGFNPLVKEQSTSQPLNGCTTGVLACPSSSLHGTPTNTDTGSTYASCSTQIPTRANHHSPAPSSSSHASSNGTVSSSTATSDSNKSTSPSSADDKLVSMPFYQFKKILDSPSVPVEKKSNIKTMRRRGKNKVAAKACRQRKVELVMGLQQEIDQLRALKDTKSSQEQSLQREIESWRSHCIATYHQKRQLQHMC